MNHHDGLGAGADPGFDVPRIEAERHRINVRKMNGRPEAERRLRAGRG